MVLTLSWGACAKVGVLILFFHATKNIIKKLQEKYCPLCKTDASCSR